MGEAPSSKETLPPSEQELLQEVYDQAPEVSAAHSDVVEAFQRLEEQEGGREFDDLNARYKQAVTQLNAYRATRSPEESMAMGQALAEVEQNLVLIIQNFMHDRDLNRWREQFENSIGDIQAMLPAEIQDQGDDQKKAA